MTVAAPLPRWVTGSLACSLLVIGGLGLFLDRAMPTLRQGRLLDEAVLTCQERREAALEWLEREPAMLRALERERAEEAERSQHLLQADDEAEVRSELTELADSTDLELTTFRLGTTRRGEAFDTVPATLKLSGDRAEFPLFLEAFYKQTRIVRLVALDLEAPEFGTQRAVATLRWEFAAPARRDQTVRVASRWLPPAAARQSRSSAIAAWNEGRLTELEEATANLRRLGPELRRLAAVEAEQSALEQERRSLARWQETGEAERRAVLRKLPLLLHRLDVSAVGRAGLRPGPGGTLQIVDDD